MNFVIVQRIRLVHRATAIVIRGQLINIHCSIKVRPLIKEMSVCFTLKSLHLLLKPWAFCPRQVENTNLTF